MHQLLTQLLFDKVDIIKIVQTGPHSGSLILQVSSVNLYFVGNKEGVENCSQLHYTKFSYSFNVTAHQISIELLLIKASSLAFRLTPPTVFISTSKDYEVIQHILISRLQYTNFGRVITHQTQLSSQRILLSCSSGVSCSVCNVFSFL